MPHLRTLSRFFVLFGLAVGLAACATTSRTPTTADDVLEALREEGVSIQPAGVASQPALTTPGRAYNTPQGPVELYVYRSESSALLDARQFSGAAEGPSAVVFQGNNVIALYFGTDVTVERALSEVVGGRLF